MAKPSGKPEPSTVSSASVLHGLSLPAPALTALQKRGIYCASGVSLEHQHLAKRYVLRGIESGGAVADMGRICAFLSADGGPLPWLQSIDSIAVNGRHAIFIAESLVRIEMLRTVRTYELAISLHSLVFAQGRTRPEITSRLLFRGRDGVLPIDLWKDEHKALRGKITPVFYDRSGEPLALPDRFEEAIRKVTRAVCCIGCRHTHVGVAPSRNSLRNTEVPPTRGFHHRETGETMSQHYLESTSEAGDKLLVTMGYDRPLDYVFCTVFDKDEEVIYSNLDDDDAGTELQDVEYYRSVLQRLGVQVPESMFREVKADQRGCVGNRVETHFADV